MRRCTFRYATKSVDFGSPTWQQIECLLKAYGIYWFLTDPYNSETMAIMVAQWDEQKFLDIVNTKCNANFYGRELT